MQPMMQAAAVALARERNWLASAMIHHFIEPLALEHRDNVKTLREGQQATVSLYRKRALGFRRRARFQILTRFLDPQCLSECGFVIDISLARHENALRSDPACWSKTLWLRRSTLWFCTCFDNAASGPRNFLTLFWESLAPLQHPAIQSNVRLLWRSCGISNTQSTGPKRNDLPSSKNGFKGQRLAKLWKNVS